MLGKILRYNMNRLVQTTAVLLTGLCLVFTGFAEAQGIKFVSIDKNLEALSEARELLHFAPAEVDEKNRAALNKIISVDMQDVTMETALKHIANSADLKISYSKSTDMTLWEEPVNIQYDRATVLGALYAALGDTGLRLTLSSRSGNGHLVVVEGSVMEVRPEQANLFNDIFQETISGTVVDAATGETIPGMNIVLMDTEIGTTTDMDGRYELSVPSLDGTLVFSFVGYQTQEVPIEGRTEINVEMEQMLFAGEELVVVGYGTRERINLTGSVGIARSERLENRSIANVGEGLQGIIPNLNVTVPSGDPADSPNFNIRGFESISGGSPLILVDGIPMDLNRINPNDIESVSVLKDAAAAAIYGARGAFGVVLVETKKGTRGERIGVTLNSQFSQGTPILNMDPVTDPYQFVLARNRANQRTNGSNSYDQDYIDGTRAWSENPTEANRWGVVDGNLRLYGFNDYHDRLVTDWQPTHQHDLSISGGGENSTYYVSLGHYQKDGYLRQNNEKFKRNNVLIDASFDITEWLTLEPRIQFDSERSDKPHFYNWDVNINTLARVNPIMPVQFPDLEYYLEPGDREDFEQYIGMYFGGTNFFPYLEDGGRQTYTNNDLFLKQGITLLPIENLQIRSDFTYNQFNRNFQDVASQVDIINTDLTNLQISNGFSGDDWIDNRNNSNQYYVFNIYAEYNFNLFENHDVTAMVGFNQEWGLNTYQRAQARSLITPQITNLNATVGSQHTFGSATDIAMRGAFYRLNYIYDDRYLMEFNGRYDGTSRFPEDDRFGFFPSFSAGWIVSNEGFMSGTGDILDVLKFRASYGTLGNQNVETPGGDPIYYPYIPTMGIGQSPYIMSSGQIPYVNPAGLVSPSLTWETVTSRNLGVDITMFGGKFDMVFDIYTRETLDMLMSVNFPSILGTGAPQQNAADLKTSGWELELNWRQIVNNDFQYNIGIALSDWTSVITKFDNPNNSLGNYYEGQKLGEIWGYETLGIFQSEDEIANHADQTQIGSDWRPGDIKYADLNGDGVINTGSSTLDDPGDRKVIGNSNPRGSFGINTGVNYKGFGLTMFFQGVLKRDHWPTDGNWTWFFPFNAGHVENYFITDTWTEDNRDAYFPAAHISTNDKKNVQVQSRYLQDAAYIRLKDITLSYNVPFSILQRIGLSDARIFVTGMNLWEYSPIRKPLDPESIYSGPIVYPMQRIFTVGTSISL